MSEPTRVSLILALRDPSNQKAWERFALQYGQRIEQWAYGWCRKWNLPDGDARTVAEEVTQGLLAAIHEKMKSYDLSQRGAGGYRRWLRTVTHNELVDFLENRQRERGTGDSGVWGRLAEYPARIELEQEFVSEFEREAFREAQERVLRGLTPRDRQIIETLGWGDGRAGKPAAAGATPARPSAKEVAGRHGISVVAALKVKSRATALLKTAMESLLQEADCG